MADFLMFLVLEAWEQAYAFRSSGGTLWLIQIGLTPCKSRLSWLPEPEEQA
jgi:hypothetical protein